MLYEPTQLPTPNWLVGSVGRALCQYRRGLDLNATGERYAREALVTTGDDCQKKIPANLWIS